MKESNSATPTAEKPSFRVFPENWLGPMEIHRCFPSIQPLEIDLGCGKGRFLLARAARYPSINFLGIDRMLRRVRKVDRKAVRAGLENVRILRIEAYYAVSYLIPPEAASTYYIFFPDPWPKKRHHDHRLFNGPFIDALYRTLKPGGQVHIATDHLPYFNEVSEQIRRDPRFAEIPSFLPSPEERTDFELIFTPRNPIGRMSVEKR